MSAPDQRRSESAGSDGIVRGSYSYLDDKGVQRTVQYIAGAGIGYRVVKTTVGPLTHVLPAPTVPEFGLRGPITNDLSDADIGNKNDDSGSLSPSSSSGGAIRPYGNRFSNRNDDGDRDGNKYPGPNRELDLGNDLDNNDNIPTIPKRPQNYGNRRRPANRYRPNNKNRNYGENTQRPINKKPKENPGDDSDSKELYPTTTGYPPKSRPNFDGSNFGENDDLLNPINSNDNSNINRNNNNDDDNTNKDNNNASNNNKNDNVSNNNNNNLQSGDFPKGPVITRDSDENYGDKIPEVKLDGISVAGDDDKDSTLIKNVGDLYFGLPPGAVVRAHVQSIDLIPIDARAPSPAKALKRESESYL